MELSLVHEATFVHYADYERGKLFIFQLVFSSNCLRNLRLPLLGNRSTIRPPLSSRYILQVSLAGKRRISLLNSDALVISFGQSHVTKSLLLSVMFPVVTKFRASLALTRVSKARVDISGVGALNGLGGGLIHLLIV